MTLPKFSIVIPTVNRHELLEKTIAGCLLSSYPNLEVLVSDNFSTPETAKVVGSFRTDPRVRYVRTTRRLSMPDHWEFAWQQSKGDYIIINGDDDALSPSLVARLAEIAVRLKTALISWDAGLYYHPDWDLSGRNTFVFMSSHSRLLFDVNPQAVFASYARLEIPLCFPQGTRMCFSRRLADRAVAKTGRVFWPPYPDYSAPLLLLGLLRGERYIYWDALMGYGGRSRDSNAAAWDKEGSKTGNPQRARDYFSELQQQEDVYPHSALKIRAYCNGHVETLNLLRRLIPEVFARHHVDQAAFIAAVELELRGIGIHNPFLGQRERHAFDAFVKEQDSAIVKQAMEIVKKKMINESIEKWGLNHWRLLWPTLDFFLHQSLDWYAVRAKKFLTAQLNRSRSTPTKHGVTSSQPKLATGYLNGKIWLDCASFGGKDGLDLIRKFDDIAVACDRKEVNNLAEFFIKGFLVAAHDPDHLFGTGNPVTIEEHNRP